MPSFIQSRLSDASNEQQAGTFIGVGVMGALSALIVSACVAPALIAALTFIARPATCCAAALALFVDGHRHGHAAAAGRRLGRALLPRAGAWMDTVKNLFGVMFLAVAVWMLSRIVPGWLEHDALGGAGAGARAGCCGARTRRPRRRAVAARASPCVAASMASALLAGAALRQHQPAGADSAARRRSRSSSSSSASRRVADLEREVAAASRPRQLGDARLLCRLVRVVQRNGAQHVHRGRGAGGARATPCCCRPMSPRMTMTTRRCCKHFGIFGPPTIAFYGADGAERRNFRVVGFMKAAEFAAVVRQAVAPATSPTT